MKLIISYVDETHKSLFVSTTDILKTNLYQIIITKRLEQSFKWKYYVAYISALRFLIETLNLRKPKAMQYRRKFIESVRFHWTSDKVAIFVSQCFSDRDQFSV